MPRCYLLHIEFLSKNLFYKSTFLTKIRNFSFLLPSPCKIVPTPTWHFYSMNHKKEGLQSCAALKELQLRELNWRPHQELNSKHCWVTNFSWKMQIPAQTFFDVGHFWHTFIYINFSFHLNLTFEVIFKRLKIGFFEDREKVKMDHDDALILKWERICICILASQVSSFIFFSKRYLGHFLYSKGARLRSLIILLHFESSIF